MIIKESQICRQKYGRYARFFTQICKHFLNKNKNQKIVRVVKCNNVNYVHGAQQTQSTNKTHEKRINIKLIRRNN